MLELLCNSFHYYNTLVCESKQGFKKYERFVNILLGRKNIWEKSLHHKIKKGIIKLKIFGFSFCKPMVNIACEQ